MQRFGGAIQHKCLGAAVGYETEAALLLRCGHHKPTRFELEFSDEDEASGAAAWFQNI